MSYKCKTCGETHDDLQDIGFQYPDYYFGIPEDERESRIDTGTDLCVIDDEYYFIRGVIYIPIHDYEHDFGIGVWVSQKKENFEQYVENPDTSDIGPFFGWLSNNIPFYSEDTVSLKTMAHFQGNNSRPLIEIDECEHKIYNDYSKGILLDEAWEMVHWNASDDENA